MHADGLARRGFLATLATLAALAAGARAGRAAAPPGDAAFTYEVTRSPEEWRARLTPTEYEVMREGRTEFPRSSALWDEVRDGLYRCKGCDLPLFESRWKLPLDKGWAFFRYARPDALLMRPETLPPGYGSGMAGEMPADATIIEVHCRRCASHMGHLLPVGDDFLHCVNGTALTFHPAAG